MFVISINCKEIYCQEAFSIAENLSKSLQSLRYLYDDLAKKGVFYSSEAEFRAYEIMLNLSDSNVFR